MQIKNLDMAAAITTATGQNAVLNDHLEDGLTGFFFPDTPEVTAAAALFYTGELTLPAKQLLRVRGDLYRQLKHRGGKR